MGAHLRIPLRVLLPCLAVSLVASGAVAAGTGLPSSRKAPDKPRLAESRV